MIGSFFEFLGRHATKLMAGGVLLGLLVPQLAELARPLLLPGLLVPLTVALTRLDFGALVRHARRPWLVLGLSAWVLLVSPLLMALVTMPLPLPPDLRTALVLMAAAPPIVSASALAFILGLDAELVVAVILVATALVPFTLPPIALWLLGLDLDIGLLALMGRLGLLVAGAFVGALVLRRLISPQWIASHGKLLDGIAVTNLLIFALAIMAGVQAVALARPGYFFLVIATAFAANLGLQTLGGISFGFLGRRPALSIALITGNCNMGLVLVSMADRASIDVAAFFALAQLPIYMLPALLAPLYRRLLHRPSTQ